MSKASEQADEVIFFGDGEAFRAWLADHHDSATELWVGFHKKASGSEGISWAEAVDEALCYGWIDAVRKRIDDVSYKIRFTRRKARSTWSTVNLKRVPELIDAGRMRAAGMKAYDQRQETRSGIYAYEQQDIEFDEAMGERFQANPGAWAYFESAPPWYRRAATWWVMSAKREETRLRRLRTLIDESARGRWIPSLRRGPATGENA